MTPVIRVGYSPVSRTLTAPGDRRRFCAYALARGLELEIASPNRDYDLVVVSDAGDIARWARAGDHPTKIVYDLISPHLAVPPDFKDRLRGVGKYVIGELSRPVPSYRQAVERMCRRADAVVCVTEEQRHAIEPLCPNVHVVLDIQDYAVHGVKSDYTAGDTLNLFWEGLPYTLPEFGRLRDVLRELADERPVALHLMTDLSYGRLGRHIGAGQTRNFADKLFSRAYLYEWNELLLSQVASGCDLGVIPLDLSNPFARDKPENKLLLMWRMGLPALCSATPAYERAMRAAGVDMSCTSADDWAHKLRHYAADADARRIAGERGHAYAEREFSRDRMLARWDAVLESVGLG